LNGGKRAHETDNGHWRHGVYRRGLRAQHAAQLAERARDAGQCRKGASCAMASASCAAIHLRRPSFVTPPMVRDRPVPLRPTRSRSHSCRHRPAMGSIIGIGGAGMPDHALRKPGVFRPGEWGWQRGALPKARGFSASARPMNENVRRCCLKLSPASGLNRVSKRTQEESVRLPARVMGLCEAFNMHRRKRPRKTASTI
jgi:hypothetical protein